MKRFSLPSLHGIPSLFVHGDTTRLHEESGSTAVLSNQSDEKITIWYSGECTSKSNVPSFVKLPRAHAIAVVPGYVRVLNTGSSNPEESAKPEARMIEIDSKLSFTCNKAEVTLKYPQAENPRGAEKTYVFSTPKDATAFVAAIQEELNRSYIHSEVFETFERELNTRIRECISAGDLPLRALYYAGLSEKNPRMLINALYSNYRIMLGCGQGTAESFATLLSAVARDPVLLVLFLCCRLELSEAMLSGFDNSTSTGSTTSTGGEETDNLTMLTKLLVLLQSTVTAPEWRDTRSLFLAQFQYPHCDQESSGLTSAEVLMWSLNFTTAGYSKLLLNSHVLQRLLKDQKYLCYTFLYHHATQGGSYFIELVQEVFATVPKDYLFASFSADEVRASLGEQPRQTDRHHFVDFLFNPNLADEAVFQTLLMAFKNSRGYDDDFFKMFLTEAFGKRAHEVAVKVLRSILFHENGEPNISALQSCGCIPVTIFKVLVAGVPTSKTQSIYINDHMRLLLEIALSFEYYACTSSELSYVTTISALFAKEHATIQQFTKLVEVMDFPAFVAELCNLNLPEGTQQQRAEGRVFIRPARHAVGAVHLASYDTVTMIATSSPTAATAGRVGTAEGSLSVEGKGQFEASAPPIATSITSESQEADSTAALPKAAAYYGDTPYVTSENLPRAYYGRSESLHTAPFAAPQNTGAVSVWTIRSAHNLSALVYGFMTLVVSSGPLPSLTEAAAPRNETLSTFLAEVPQSFFAVMLQAGSEMRALLMIFLKAKFHILNPYDRLLEQPYLLCRASHFSYSFLHALSYEFQALRLLAVDLITVAVHLDQTSELWACLFRINGTVGASVGLQEEMQVVLRRVKGRDSAELQAAAVSLQTLAEYAQILVHIQQRQSAQQRSALSAAVERMLSSLPVAQWADWFANFRARGSL